MKSVTASQMQTIDGLAIRRYGIPSLLLMENAGRSIADLAERVIPARFRRESRAGSPIKAFGDDRKPIAKILIICGKGNNGGDGFAAARHLHNRGYKVQLQLLASPNDFKDDARVNFEILKKMKIPVAKWTTQANLKKKLKNVHLILDGIFGVGLARNVDGHFRDSIEAINESKSAVLAIDVPSGLNSDTGKVMGVAVRAKWTGTLAIPKRGLYIHEGPVYAGSISVLDISIPRKLIRSVILSHRGLS